MVRDFVDTTASCDRLDNAVYVRYSTKNAATASATTHPTQMLECKTIVNISHRLQDALSVLKLDTSPNAMHLTSTRHLFYFITKVLPCKYYFQHQVS